MKLAFLTGLRSAFSGLALTLRHLRRAGRGGRHLQNVRQPGYFGPAGGQGIVTLSYPHETLPVPEVGRYKLDCEIDDCIVCDKCARICPVDCIDIVAIKSPEEFGKTSDGTPKRLYAAKFDIDMAKCCYCGLCTTVCPTECLTMQPEYDYTVTDITKMTFAFAEMSPEEIARRERELADFQADKAAAKVAKNRNDIDSQNTLSEQNPDAPAKPKVLFKPFGNKPKPAPVEPNEAGQPPLIKEVPTISPVVEEPAPASSPPLHIDIPPPVSEPPADAVAVKPKAPFKPYLTTPKPKPDSDEPAQQA